MTYRVSALCLSLVCALAVLPGCNKQSEKDLIASANKYLAAKDSKAAMIQLKTALQQAPNSGEARFLLGRALLDSGDATGAALELGKAEQIGWEPVRTVPALARALLASGEERKLLLRFAGTDLPDKAATADLQTSIGLAHAKLGEFGKAEAALRSALTAAPDLPRAHLFKAQLAAKDKDYATASAELDTVIARDANNAEAWLLKGQLQLQQGADIPAALTSLRKAVSIEPKMMTAHEAIVSTLLAKNDQAGAAAHVEEMKKTAPKHPLTMYLDAQVAYIAKDYRRSREVTTAILQGSPTNAMALTLAGAADYQLKAFAPAEAVLSQAVQIAPQMGFARLLLAQTYLRLGQPAQSLSTIKPLLDRAEPPVEVLAVGAEALLLNGDAKAAEALFKRAAAARPDDTRLRTELAMSQVAAGTGGEKAMAELNALAESDKGALANLAVISDHIRNKRVDKALKAVDVLDKKQPDKPLPADLRGRVLLIANDRDGARASFERALKIDPTYFPAVINLAALDLAAGGTAAARKRFEDFQVVVPKHAQATLAIASLVAKAGGSREEVEKLISKAITENPTLPGPRIALVEHHLAARDFKRALSTAQDAASALPMDRDILFAVARASLAGGELQQASKALNQLAAREPLSPRAWLSLADVQIALKDRSAASRMLQKALDVTPDLLVAQRGLVDLALLDSRYDDARNVAKKVQEQRPQAGIGYVLEADTLAAQKKWEEALALYRTALQKEKSTELATRLHGALVTANRTADAEKFSATWQREQPGDSAFLLYLGDRLLRVSDWPGAEAQYQHALKAQPKNAIAMNNIAWLLQKQGKPGALAMAEKANQAAPDQPAILDTLAGVLLAENQLARAVEIQQQAVTRAPGDPGMRLNLARILVKAGKKAQAKTELDTLAKLGDGFPGKSEVVALQKQL